MQSHFIPLKRKTSSDIRDTHMLQGYRTATEIKPCNKHEYIHIHTKQKTDLVKQTV